MRAITAICLTLSIITTAIATVVALVSVSMLNNLAETNTKLVDQIEVQHRSIQIVSNLIDRVANTARKAVNSTNRVGKHLGIRLNGVGGP